MTILLASDWRNLPEKVILENTDKRQLIKSCQSYEKLGYECACRIKSEFRLVEREDVEVWITVMERKKE